MTNYYIGKDPAKWRLGVKNFAKLRAPGVYPGVDVVYYGDHRRLEFDFVVAPKSDPGVIALSFSGMDKLYKDANGDLVAEIDGQPVRFVKPYAYQKVDGVSKPVPADYELAAVRQAFISASATMTATPNSSSIPSSPTPPTLAAARATSATASPWTAPARVCDRTDLLQQFSRQLRLNTNGSSPVPATPTSQNSAPMAPPSTTPRSSAARTVALRLATGLRWIRSTKPTLSALPTLPICPTLTLPPSIPMI